MDTDEVSTTTNGLDVSAFDYEETTALMQAQIDIQKEKINNLVTLTEELKNQVQELLKWKESLPVSKEIKTEYGHQRQEKELNSLDWTERNDSNGKMSVADLVKQAAEEVVAHQQTASSSGFVYSDENGWYFDVDNGLYYDPKTQLTYNINDKKYYKYDNDRKEYDLFPSEAAEHLLSDSKFRPDKQDSRKTRYPITKLTHRLATKEKKSYKKSPRKKRRKVLSDEVKKEVKKESGDDDQAMEEGELSSSSNSQHSETESDPMSDSGATSTSTVDIDSDDNEEPAPCIRAIVKSSASTLKKGTLFIVTFMGGTIGREGSHHTILIADDNMSKSQASITYEVIDVDSEVTEYANEGRKKSAYYISDCGSKNGTFLNGQRIGEKSEIVHGSTLKVGDTMLLLHIHPGQSTCGHCEPGLIIENEPMYAITTAASKESKESSRKKELKKLRRRFGVQGDATSILTKLPESYKDRAEERRVTKGSDNPFEKTQVASIDEPIKEDNRGFGMMKKMGWAPSQGLGQSNQEAIKEPIKFEVKSGRSGLGSL